MGDRVCALCGSVIRLVQLNLTEAIDMCGNMKCVHPFHNLMPRLNFIERNFEKMCVEEEINQQKGLDFTLSSFQNETNDDNGINMDNFFVNGTSIQMTEEDIQAFESVFEALQSCPLQN